jgi:hypothetical protein
MGAWLSQMQETNHLGVLNKKDQDWPNLEHELPCYKLQVMLVLTEAKI